MLKPHVYITLMLFATACQTTPPATGPNAPTPSASASPIPMPSPNSPTPAPDTSSPPASATPAPPADPSLLARIASLEIQADSRFLELPGSSRQLRVVAKDAQGNPITLDAAQLQWSSSRPQDISVSNTGLVQAREAFGYSEIRVQLPNQPISAQLLISVSGGETGGSFSSAPNTRPSLSGSFSGRVGDSITLQGSNLNNIASITLDGIPVTFSSTSQGLQVVLPGGALSGQLVINTNAGQVTTTIALGNRVWFVDRDATGANTGNSWRDAFTTVQEALVAAQSGDQVWVAEGKYTPASSDRNAYFQVPAEVSVYGGFVGNEYYPSTRSISNHETILSGDLNNNDSYASLPGTNMAENSLNIVRHGANVVFDGLVIEGGNANNTFDLSTPRGAGIYSGANALTLRNSIVRNNYSADRSGGWHTEASGTLTIENTQFLRNIAASSGGAMRNEQANLILKGVTFAYNQADGGGGAGIYQQAGNITLTQTTFDHNQANGSGGAGIYNPGPGSITGTQVTFSHNQANGGGGAGILQSSNGVLTITQGTFSHNQANGGGGGGVRVTASSSTTAKLTDVTFTHNQATGAGGSGLYLSNVNLQIEKATVSNNNHSLGAIYISNGNFSGQDMTVNNNTATSPGGALNISGSLNLNRAQFSQNTSASVGGAIYHSNNQPLTLNQTNFLNNSTTGGPGGAVYTSANTLTVSNSRFENNTTNSNGGGIYKGSGDPSGVNQLSNVRFVGNTAVSPGGGAYLSGGSLALQQVQFNDNSSSSNGGGLNFSGTTATLTDVRFENNSAVSPGGGANMTLSGALTSTNTRWFNNSSDDTGGGLHLSAQGDITLERSYFIGNTAGDPGGGLFLSGNNSHTATLTHGVFHNNSSTGVSSGYGGGLYAMSIPLTLNHITFGENQATVSGDAAYLNVPSTTLRNSIVWDAEANPLHQSSTLLTSLYSVVRDLSTYTLEAASTGNGDQDPLFVNANNALGNDNTMGTGDDGLALQAGSPALNLDISGVVLFPTDILRRNRSGNPDAGAYERP